MVLTVGGAVALGVGLLALLYGMDWVRDGRPMSGSSDDGDAIQALLLGGGTLAVVGFVALLRGVFLLAIGRNLERRAQRLPSEGAAKGRKKGNG